MIDAILSPHINTLTCGTAKWNVRLAEQLGVPCEPLTIASVFKSPLVSARLTEMTGWVSMPPVFDALVHDWDEQWRGVVCHARRVFAANPVIADQIRPYRADVQTIWCPSSLVGNPDRGNYRLLTYGMAHKLVAKHYEHLKDLLDRAKPNYTISLSTAVHEGSPWDESLQQSSALLRAIFGDRLRVLGYLADDALAKELHDCDVVALFYDPALRSNNTTAWAALYAGKPLVTNTDEFSPPELCGRVVNLQSHLHWPWDAVLKDYGRYGQQTAQEMSWAKLIEVLRAA